MGLEAARSSSPDLTVERGPPGVPHYRPPSAPDQDPERAIWMLTGLEAARSSSPDLTVERGPPRESRASSAGCWLMARLSAVYATSSSAAGDCSGRWKRDTFLPVTCANITVQGVTSCTWSQIFSMPRDMEGGHPLARDLRVTKVQGLETCIGHRNSQGTPLGLYHPIA